MRLVDDLRWHRRGFAGALGRVFSQLAKAQPSGLDQILIAQSRVHSSRFRQVSRSYRPRDFIKDCRIFGDLSFQERACLPKEASRGPAIERLPRDVYAEHGLIR